MWWFLLALWWLAPLCLVFSRPDPLVELCHWLQGVGTGGAGDLEVT